VSDNYSFYKILNIVGEEINTKTLISENFKKLALANHPDFVAGDKKIITERFYNICLAYLFLNDEKLRILYDNDIKSDEDNIIIDEGLKIYEQQAAKLATTKYKEFIQILKDELKLISELNAQTSLGLYYDFIEFLEDSKSFELYIDPEDIKPKISLLAEILIEFVKVTGIILIIYIAIYITAYIRI